MHLHASITFVFVLFALGCTSPPDRPVEASPETASSEPPPQERNAPGEEANTATQSNTPDIGGLTRRLEDLEPGLFKELPIEAAFTVFDAFESSFEEFERGVGQRIQTMYQVMKDQSWDKAVSYTHLTLPTIYSV